MERLGHIMGPDAKSPASDIDYHGQKSSPQCANGIKSIGNSTQ
jgi:hypothetical protein